MQKAEASKNTKPGEEAGKPDLKIVGKEPMPEVSLDAEGLYDETRLGKIAERKQFLAGLIVENEKALANTVQEFLKMSMFKQMLDDNTGNNIRIHELAQEEALILARKKAKDEASKKEN